MSLALLQRAFRSWLVDGSDAAVARIGAAARPGLLVYQNNYRSQLVDCLEDAFARVKLWLGDAGFLAAAVAHIDRVPPSAWTLDAYPRHFPETLAALYPDDPEIAELAWLDRALAEAFAGPDASTLVPEALSEIDWDDATLHLAPTIAIARVETNAAAIWSALSAGETPPAAEQLAEPAALLVWRSGFTPCFRTVDRNEHIALRQIIADPSFATLCAAMVEQFGEADGIAVAGACFAQWLGDGLLVDTAGIRARI
jgi:hypothetical protein